ncbi:hypothetical protein HK102_007136, partial [Quaeritorhiza haematococci]
MTAMVTAYPDAWRRHQTTESTAPYSDDHRNPPEKPPTFSYNPFSKPPLPPHPRSSDPSQQYDWTQGDPTSTASVSGYPSRKYQSQPHFPPARESRVRHHPYNSRGDGEADLEDCEVPGWSRSVESEESDDGRDEGYRGVSWVPVWTGMNENNAGLGRSRGDGDMRDEEEEDVEENSRGDGGEEQSWFDGAEGGETNGRDRGDL